MKQVNVGFTCGSFDLFHAGHVEMLREVRSKCHTLIVGIQSDPTIDRPEKNSPVQSIIERQIQVAACRYVDETYVYNTEADLLVLLSTLPIDMRFLGMEYMNKEYTGRNLSIDVTYNSREHSFSSTDLRRRVYLAELIDVTNLVLEEKYERSSTCHNVVCCSSAADTYSTKRSCS